MPQPWCLVFVKEKGPSRRTASIQFQVPQLTITLQVRNLAFARKAIRFVAGTRDNPKYRDKDLGGGRYRRMPDKFIDLSPSFHRTKVVLTKDGEFDDRYFLGIKAAGASSMSFELSGPLLDAVMGGLREIAEEHED